MSDKKHDSQEDLAIEQAWNQVMATGHEPRLLQGGEAPDPQKVREYTELLGMLPYELTLQTPPAHVKEALMARVLADAQALQPVAPEAGQGWSGWLALVGGLPALGGLVTATCVGFWIGVAPPEALPDLGAWVMGTEADAEVYGFGWDIEEG